MKGRNISTAIRQIDDIINHESNKESKRVVVSLDYSKYQPPSYKKQLKSYDSVTIYNPWSKYY